MSGRIGVAATKNIIYRRGVRRSKIFPGKAGYDDLWLKRNGGGNLFRKKHGHRGKD